MCLIVLELFDAFLQQALEVSVFAALRKSLFDPHDVAVPWVQRVVGVGGAAQVDFEFAVKEAALKYIHPLPF